MDTSNSHKQGFQMLFTIAGHYEHNGSVGDTYPMGHPSSSSLNKTISTLYDMQAL